MVAHMKTTIEVSTPVLEAAKQLARREGVTLRVLVEEGLRDVLAARASRKRFTLKNASYRGRGVQPGMVEGQWDVIRDLAYDGRGA